MDGKDFLDVAKRLYNSSHEADRRTSISRAYYAFFNHVKSCLVAKGIVLSKAAAAHEKAYQYLHNSGIEEADDIASELNSLRTKRNEADYNMKASDFDAKNCLLWYMKAEKCITDFNSINTNLLAEKIMEYKKRINEA